MCPSHVQKRSVWPARWDVAQSATGLFLGLFMWMHMVMVSSILISKDAMYFVARMFEGEPILGKPYPVLVSGFAAFILALVIIHAFLAMRKFPSSYREYAVLSKHSTVLKHGDTWLWGIQVVTGFILFFAVSIHLYQLMLNPSDIGPYASSDRVWTGGMWPLYLIMLFAVELHGGIGIYRVLVKWGFLQGVDARTTRKKLKLAKWAFTLFFIVLGLFTLAAYIKIGIEHQDNAGEKYVPSYHSSAVMPLDSQLNLARL